VIGRKFFSLRMLRLHLTLIIVVIAFAMLADWQFHRAFGGNELSWAYAVEWPLFIVYAFVLWRRLVTDELTDESSPQNQHRNLPFPISKFAGHHREKLAMRNAQEDIERESYNAYLASLTRKDRAASNERDRR
jgi:Ca2+/H+ antiporter